MRPLYRISDYYLMLLQTASLSALLISCIAIFLYAFAAHHVDMSIVLMQQSVYLISLIFYFICHNERFRRDTEAFNRLILIYNSRRRDDD
ncbi:MAG: hypothetical protein FWG19_00035 [Methanomassiliicoccaceae archaeon]|nr:hypothetical protein [Methanomassiliicoccaceae archaeon]